MKVRIAVLLVCMAGWSVNVWSACPTQPPTLTFPPNGATSVTQPVNLDWTDVPNATTYRVWASFNGGPQNIIALTQDSRYSVALPAGSVDWYVEALAAGCTTSVSSAHSHFTAVGGTATCPQNPASPNLLSPANNATNVSSPVAFAWTAVPGASSYRVYAQVNGAAASIVATTTLTQVPSVALPQGNITWFVEARFDNCPSTFSRFSSFSIATAAQCPTTATTLLSPANNAPNATSPVTFQWSQVPGAIAYKLFIGGSAATADLVGTTTDTMLTRIVPEGTSIWFVDTMFPGCNDVRSAEFKFTVPAPPSCGGSIALITPADNAIVNSPAQLSWTPVANAAAYRVWASFDGSAPTILARTTGPSQSLNTPSGNVVWFIEALFANCPSILSAQGHFTVAAGVGCGNKTAPVLASPINGVQTQSPVTFTWNAANGAMLYRVWVSVDGGPFDDVGVTKSTTLQSDVGSGNVQWYVETFFEGCPPVSSAKATFSIPRVNGCSGEQTLLISPADGSNSVSAPVTMVWSAVPDATEYRVFATFNGSSPLVIGKTTATSLTKSLPPGAISWWVEADFDSCAGTKSTHSFFAIPRAANCGTTPAQLVAPADGFGNVASPTRLDWDPLSGAVSYDVFIRHNGGPPSFLGETTDSELTRRLPEGSFEWWVVTFFAACPPLESRHSTFTIPVSTCDNRKPILISPADGTTNLSSPVHLVWSAVPHAKSYKVWAANGDDGASVLATTIVNKLTTSIPSGSVTWYVEAQFDNCPSQASAESTFSVRKSAAACTTPDRPKAKAAAQVASGTPYNVHWSAVANAGNYELQEATTAGFTNATSQLVNDVSTTLTHTVSAPSRFYYRVRAVSSCTDDRGPFSRAVSVVILPQEPNAQHHTSVDVGSQNGVTQQIALPGTNPPVTFSARADKPWITVSPSTGTLGPQGATLNVSFDPAALKLGTNTGTVILTFGSGKLGAGPLAVTPVVPVSVSMVTPVQPTGKNTPPPDSLIIPAVGHAPGAFNTLFESDVRVANTSAQTMKYQLNFTLTNTDGTQSGQSSSIEIDPGATMALDDILANFFGIGGTGDAALGVLEVRPLSTASSAVQSSGPPSVQTVASSRTFTTGTTGTFGQFIPAVPFAQFIGKSPDPSAKSVLSLQQVAQSSAFRTNLGLVEAAGESATVLIHVFDDTGREVIPPVSQSLPPSGHVQLNAFLANNGVTNLTDGRIEVEVTSSTGKVTAYASVLDNQTSDPLLVSPVLKGSVSANRYTLPGVGSFDSFGAHWRSDVRIFNSATASVPVTLSYYAQSDPTHPSTMSTTLQAGETRAMDDIIATNWPSLTQTAGSLVITSPSASSLVATARTYTKGDAGTYGQFIPGVTSAQAVGSGERALQLLQLEQSNRYRTNIGLAETSGNAATAHVTLVVPDSKVTASVDIPLAANGFFQINSLSGFGLGTVYNGRVTVTVSGGTGRITAYGSVIDNTTNDPTYVPAQ